MYGWVPETITTLFLIIIYFYLEGNCLTILCWFLPYIKMNYRYIYVPSLLNPLPAPAPSHPSWLSQSTRLVLPASYSRFPLAIYSTCGNTYMSMLLSQCILPSPPAVATRLFSTSASPPLPCRQAHQHHLSRFLSQHWWLATLQNNI